MPGKYLFVFFLLPLMALATPDQEVVKNLKQRIHLQQSGGGLIKSYTGHSQSYIYDQALAIITLSREQEKTAARQLLQGLSQLQLPDGSLYFSYNLDGSSPYPIEGDKRFAGAIAWVSLAASFYQIKFGDKHFESFNHKILTYLSSQMKQAPKGQAVRFGPSNIASTEWREDETAALEHNLDALAAFSNYSRLAGPQAFQHQRSELLAFIRSLWNKSGSHFWSGVNLRTGAINKDEYYLDNQSWTLLALPEHELTQFNAQAALELNCELFLVRQGELIGFMDRRSVRTRSLHSFVWSEGTAGQVLAMKRMKAKHCGENSEQEILQSIWKLKKEDGGIAYASASSDPDFSNDSSVAGTTWFYFARNNFNPFQLAEI
jgi:hypothetical protein